MTHRSFAALMVMAAGAAMVSAAPPATAAVGAYQFQSIDVLSGTVNCDNTDVNSINNNGVLLGTFWCAPRSSGFVYRSGAYSIFRLHGKTVDTEPSGISNNGKYIVVDSQHNYKGAFTSYLRTSGKFHKLADPHAGALGTVVEGVNNHKEIVGLYYPGKSTTKYRGFIERNGTFHTFHLAVKSARSVALVDVNDSGELVGYFADNKNHYHGFLVKGHKTRVINIKGAGKGKFEGTLALSVADNGNLCGNVITGKGKPTASTLHGWVDIGGHVRALKVPASFTGHDTNAGTINDAGEVAGDYVQNTGNGGWLDVGFSATPSG